MDLGIDAQPRIPTKTNRPIIHLNCSLVSCTPQHITCEVSIFHVLYGFRVLAAWILHMFNMCGTSENMVLVHGNSVRQMKSCFNVSKTDSLLEEIAHRSSYIAFSSSASSQKLRGRTRIITWTRTQQTKMKCKNKAHFGSPQSDVKCPIMLAASYTRLRDSVDTQKESRLSHSSYFCSPFLSSPPNSSARPGRAETAKVAASSPSSPVKTL